MIQLHNIVGMPPKGAVRPVLPNEVQVSSFALAMGAIAVPGMAPVGDFALPDTSALNRQAIAVPGKDLPLATLADDAGTEEAPEDSSGDSETIAADTADLAFAWFAVPTPTEPVAPPPVSGTTPAAAVAAAVDVAVAVEGKPPVDAGAKASAPAPAPAAASETPVADSVDVPVTVPPTEPRATDAPVRKDGPAAPILVPQPEAVKAAPATVPTLASPATPAVAVTTPASHAAAPAVVDTPVGVPSPQPVRTAASPVEPAPAAPAPAPAPALSNAPAPSRQSADAPAVPVQAATPSPAPTPIPVPVPAQFSAAAAIVVPIAAPVGGAAPQPIIAKAPRGEGAWKPANRTGAAAPVPTASVPLAPPLTGPPAAVVLDAGAPAAPRADLPDVASPVPVTAEPLRTGAAASTPDLQQGALDLRRQEWVGQMAERIEAMRDASPARDTRMRLAPDALGTVDVSIRQEGDRIHVHFAAESAAARQLLSDAQPRLAELAEARGLKLGQTSIDGGGTGQGAPGRNAEPQQRQPGRPTSAATTESNTHSDERIA